MKILTLRRIIGLAAVGAAYVHGKRGGNLTLASIADTLGYLWCSASERLGLSRRPRSPIPEREASPNCSASRPAGSSAANGLTGDRPRRPSND